MRKLFGTDGIRGIAGEYPLDEETTFHIGRALGHFLCGSCTEPKVVIGQDTRESSAWIGDAVASGLQSHRVQVESAGVITTPGVAYLARINGFTAGVVVSASHNPWTDNGVKVFGGNGYKLPDEVELQIENEIFEHIRKADIAKRPALPQTTLPGNEKLRAAYVDWLVKSAPKNALHGMRIAVDCANGAASSVASEVFERLGVRADLLCDKPDGRNINVDCGALYPKRVAAVVQESAGNTCSSAGKCASFDLGITFDGDADRALFSDERGNVINGDAVLLLCARAMQREGVLQGDVVVATTMSNMGLEAALRRSGIRMLRAPVGDKYVLEEMQKSGATLGGEQSGHVIFLDGESTTGDGLLTALRVMTTVARSGKPLSRLVADLKVFPQTIVNVRVAEKLPLERVPKVAESIRKAEAELDGCGRVVVRYSGTEPLARVMVEAESENAMSRIAAEIAEAIRTTLG
jgi:phosphoglucosamine mutase